MLTGAIALIAILCSRNADLSWASTIESAPAIQTYILAVEKLIPNEPSEVRRSEIHQKRLAIQSSTDRRERTRLTKEIKLLEREALLIYGMKLCGLAAAKDGKPFLATVEIEGKAVERLEALLVKSSWLTVKTNDELGGSQLLLPITPRSVSATKKPMWWQDQPSVVRPWDAPDVELTRTAKLSASCKSAPKPVGSTGTQAIRTPLGTYRSSQPGARSAAGWVYLVDVENGGPSDLDSPRVVFSFVGKKGDRALSEVTPLGVIKIGVKSTVEVFMTSPVEFERVEVEVCSLGR